MNFNQWSANIEQVWQLKDGNECEQYVALMYSITGNESDEYIHKIIESIRVRNDDGVYESTYNALWRFPSPTVSGILAEVLPILQDRIDHDRMAAFYIPIPGNGLNAEAFINAAKQWNAADKKTALTVIKKWAADDESWETVLKRLGVKRPEPIDDIPENWPEAWKIRLQNWRDDKDNDPPSGKYFWFQGKGMGYKQWIEDLDFLISFLVLRHGKKWREINTITNPLWFFAKKSVYPHFIKKVRELPESDKEKLLENIKRVNPRKYNDMLRDLAD